MSLVRGQLSGIHPSVPLKQRAVFIRSIPPGLEFEYDGEMVETLTVYCDSTTGIWSIDLPVNGIADCYMIDQPDGRYFIKVSAGSPPPRGFWWVYELYTVVPEQIVVPTRGYSDWLLRDLSNMDEAATRSALGQAFKGDKGDPGPDSLGVVQVGPDDDYTLTLQSHWAVGPGDEVHYSADYTHPDGYTEAALVVDVTGRLVLVQIGEGQVFQFQPVVVSP